MSYISLVTKTAPNIIAPAVMENGEINKEFDLHEYIKSNGFKGVYLFFYPLNFTFVCPTEIISFSEMAEEFKVRGYGVVGISVDSEYSHAKYINTERKDGGIGKIHFPLVSDLKKNAAIDYGVLFEDSIALRASFLIDSEFKVRHQLVNDLPIGRNVDEAIRTIDALLHHQQFGDVCPANWKKGDVSMEATPEGVKKYLQSQW